MLEHRPQFSIFQFMKHSCILMNIYFFRIVNVGLIKLGCLLQVRKHKLHFMMNSLRMT